MRIFIIAMAFTFAVGCSFKKDNGDKKDPALSAQEEVKKAVSSPFDKLAYAIEKNDSILFFDTIGSAKKSDLNQLSPYGLSLLEMALRQKRYDFFKELIKAGASPFRPTHYSPEGLRTTFVTDLDAKNALMKAVHGGLADATRICLMNDFAKTLEYLNENYIGPHERVCGDLDLFHYYLDKDISGIVLDDKMKIEMVKTYVNPSRQDWMKNVSALLSISLKVKDGGIISLLAVECSKFPSRCSSIAFDDSAFMDSSIDNVVETYKVFQRSISRDVIYVQGSKLPPPPLPGGKPAEGQLLDIVTYVQNIVRERIDKLDQYDKERLAQQLQELVLD